MNCALTLALSRRAGEGTQRCIERPRFEGRPLLNRDSREFGSGPQATPRFPSPLGSRVRGNDVADGGNTWVAGMLRVAGMTVA